MGTSEAFFNKMKKQTYPTITEKLNRIFSGMVIDMDTDGKPVIYKNGKIYK